MHECSSYVYKTPLTLKAFKKKRQQQDGLGSNAMNGFIATYRKHPYINKQTL
jgi:hypothetical protein